MMKSSFSSSKQVFFKRTRRGSVIRLVRENCIRRDLSYGFLSSKIQGHDISGVESAYNNHLALSFDKLCQLVTESPHKHLIFLDTNIVLHQIDLLEFQCPGTALVVITQTVLREIQHLNMSVFRRINILLKDESRSYIFYPNEVSDITTAKRDAKESINDYNDRLIRRAAVYFHELIVDHGKVMFISNDKENRRRANEEGLTASSIYDYVNDYLSEYSELFDLISATESFKLSKHPHKVLYSPYLSVKELMHGIRTKQYLKGVLRVKRDNWMDCYVVIQGIGNELRRSVNILGHTCVNRAIDGDLVVIEVVPYEEYMSKECDEFEDKKYKLEEMIIAADSAEPSYELIDGLDSSTIISATTSNETSSIENNISQRRHQVYGKVVGIMRRNLRQYAGSVDPDSIISDPVGDNTTNITNDGNENLVEVYSFLFYPVEKRLPPVRISTRRKSEILGKRILVTIDDWSVTAHYPQGHCVKILGIDGDRQTETDVLLHEFGVPSNSFSAEVMTCLPSLNWTITKEIIAERTDLRHVPIVSIDPPGCKDIDDALHCIELPNGNYEVGVHIADVTYFVHPDTPLDKEAANRSTSTYLVERRLDMLPGYLTTQLCSLRCNEDHLAFSVIWEITRSGEIVDVTFFKSAIHSVASLTYDEAQKMLDDPRDTSKYNQTVIDSVSRLNVLAKMFRKKRIEQGALTLASPEVRFKLDAETMNPSDVSAYALKESNALVEEWMLLANITVSKKILRHFPTLAILRRHQPPTREQFAPLVQAASIAANVHLDISSSKALADSLDRAIRPEDPYFNKLLRILSTRCMMPAQYFCSGELSKDQWHHYGLAAPVYTHFTSPIRRYADVLVHRLLAAAIGVIPLPAANTDRSKQDELCSHMNRRHRAAQYAQRANHPTEEVAYILSVSEQKITVLVPKFGIESAIEMQKIVSNLTDTDVRLSNDGCSLSIQHALNDVTHSYTLTVFQKIMVSIHVEEIRAGSRKLVMNIISDAFNDSKLQPKVIGSTVDSEDKSQIVDCSETNSDKATEVGINRKRMPNQSKVIKRKKLRQY